MITKLKGSCILFFVKLFSEGKNTTVNTSRTCDINIMQAVGLTLLI